jgi:hypothetical protein
MTPTCSLALNLFGARPSTILDLVIWRSRRSCVVQRVFQVSMSLYDRDRNILGRTWVKAGCQRCQAAVHVTTEVVHNSSQRYSNGVAKEHQ